MQSDLALAVLATLNFVSGCLMRVCNQSTHHFNCFGAVVIELIGDTPHNKHSKAA
ncbi:hypothetical protein [Kingella sp. (in: b-proteobacteria)]|uniref:hypothetical protein n=1 Tax=Kingella sp. (in: b-proteobacteria) TaxID=2020713 RepID=UPI0026DBB7B6|nr:hypothetical protein [Kingella sp. (in: b-proteobacteria)]MDO4657535.1 hypothetical protein [Kingella sp. (in: b-proteobacteria)]